jgi:hypothetical protein
LRCLSENDGSLSGVVADGVVRIALHPQADDHAVYLEGSMEEGVLKGRWLYQGYAGDKECGRFEARAGEAEPATLVGKVPKDDFAMPLIADEMLPGSTQGCFRDAFTGECVVALYPEGMSRPGREAPIRVTGRVLVVTPTPPSSGEDRPYMRYRQKVIIVDSWEYNSITNESRSGLRNRPEHPSSPVATIKEKEKKR